MNTGDLIPTDAEFEAIEGKILQRAQQADRHRRRRHVGIGAAVAAVAVLGTTGAVVLASAELRENTTYCYQAADLGSRSTQVGSPTDVRDAQGRPIESAIADAVDKCAAVWRIGFFEGDNPPVDDGKVYDVPELQLCVRPDGVAAVLPVEGFAGSNEKFCTDLGLSLP